MDWSNTQRAEIQYFCTSTRSRTPRLLCGCTLKLQLGFILTIFASYQITEFQLTDIKAFYKLLHTPHFGSEQLRPPPPHASPRLWNSWTGIAIIRSTSAVWGRRVIKSPGSAPAI